MKYLRLTCYIPTIHGLLHIDRVSNLFNYINLKPLLMKLLKQLNKSPGEVRI